MSTFSVSLNLTSQSTGERNKLTASFVVKDANKDFFDTVVTWHDMPDIGVDQIETLLEEVMGEPSPINLSGLDMRKVLQIQRKVSHILVTLNLIGDDFVGQDSDNKQRESEKLLGKKGKKPKKRR
jgi:hypothetical protein